MSFNNLTVKLRISPLGVYVFLDFCIGAYSKVEYWTGGLKNCLGSW